MADEADATEIPDEFQPHPDQIPSWVADERRFRLCFAIGRLIAQRDDPVFVRQLYNGDIPTDELESKTQKQSI